MRWSDGVENAGGGTSRGGKTREGKRTAREERLAAALRENLRKRKAQERARKAGGDPTGEADP